MRVFHELGADCQVTFVAVNLAKLPPLSLSNYDVLSVVQDVETLKASMTTVLGNQNVMSDFLAGQVKVLAATSKKDAIVPGMTNILTDVTVNTMPAGASINNLLAAVIINTTSTAMTVNTSVGTVTINTYI